MSNYLQQVNIKLLVFSEVAVLQHNKRHKKSQLTQKIQIKLMERLPSLKISNFSTWQLYNLKVHRKKKDLAAIKY